MPTNKGFVPRVVLLQAGESLGDGAELKVFEGMPLGKVVLHHFLFPTSLPSTGVSSFILLTPVIMSFLSYVQMQWN